jgi:hypothetical protein
MDPANRCETRPSSSRSIIWRGRFDVRLALGDNLCEVNFRHEKYAERMSLGQYPGSQGEDSQRA